MNHFLRLKIHGKDRYISVRPEHVAAVIADEGGDYATILLVTGDSYWVEPGQFTLHTLINKNTHAGMRVL
jgi:hypothetical protein